MRKKINIIGVDPGIKTGIAVKEGKKLIAVETNT